MRIMTNADGYEYVVEDGEMVPMHRLVASIEFGTKALTSMDVHHRELFDGKSIPWFNTREGVEPQEPTEHRRRTLRAGSD